MSKVDNMEAELARIDKAGLENVYVPVWRLKKLLAVVRAAKDVDDYCLNNEDNPGWVSVGPKEIKDLKQALAALGGDK